ncbi:hypothetical protein CWE22_00340 [Pseudidiomarina aestuarii]|uniref:Uncharacterized protein n=1 Tax=Pseudidiomarina aestuarii TaxID=624146 RepID=A0A7Z6ZSY5_9GAMM|nr:hypothetical protein [Pseudidiomarina aestuarii]RUO40696.1 hypothetical protein CWE22_00340 [Pseudidiomarina aestuarii]
MSESTKTNARKRLDDLILDATQTPERYEPPQNLWRGIEHGLTRQQQRSPVWLRYVWASAAVMVVAISAMTLQWVPTQSNDEVPEIMRLITAVNQHHESQRNLLLTSIQSSGVTAGELSSQTELEQLRQAAAQVTQQLMDDPNNQSLWQLLQWLHQQELELLKANFAPRQNWQQA